MVLDISVVWGLLVSTATTTTTAMAAVASSSSTAPHSSATPWIKNVSLHHSSYATGDTGQLKSSSSPTFQILQNLRISTSTCPPSSKIIIFLSLNPRDPGKFLMASDNQKDVGGIFSKLDPFPKSWFRMK